MARGKEPGDFDNDTDRMAWVRANPDAPIACACGGSGFLTARGEVAGVPVEIHEHLYDLSPSENPVPAAA